MKYFFLFLIILSQGFSLPDQMSYVEPPLPVDTPSHWSPYIKAGVAVIVPTLGIGVQYRSDQDGFDFSVNGGSSKKSQRFFSGKALYRHWSLSYPGFYCGIGAGGFYYRGGGWLFKLPCLEQVLGYEWSERKKTPAFFIQLELSEIMADNRLTPPLPGLFCGFHF